MSVKASHEGRGQALNFKEVDRARETERERVGCLPGTWGGEGRLQLRNKRLRQSSRQQLLQGKDSTESRKKP